MKKATAILLLTVFAFNMAGIFLVFKYQQHQIRKEVKLRIKEGVPNEELQLIVVTSENKNELEWKHDREFRYKNIMYDVVKKELIDNFTTIYHCVTDEQETLLFANLEDQIKKNMDAKTNGNNPLKKLLKILSHLHIQPKKYEWLPYTNQIIIHAEYADHYRAPEPEITSPPPKKV